MKSGRATISHLAVQDSQQGKNQMSGLLKTLLGEFSQSMTNTDLPNNWFQSKKAMTD